MALAYSHIKLLFEVGRSGIMKGPVSIMEFGQQNWFGDVSVQEIKTVAEILGRSQERRAEIGRQYNDIVELYERDKNKASFAFAELYYNVVFDVKKLSAIDLHGDERSIKHDLNTPYNVTEQYDLLINFGTGEHVFNQYMFFKNAHDVTRKGGFMLHSMPNQGCYDHGFFNYHPTFIFDLAKHNNYTVQACTLNDLSKKPAEVHNISREKYVELAVTGTLSNYSALFVLLQKNSDAPFVTPQQGYYDNVLPPQLKEAWEKLDR